jgi:putative hydrolase of the HAD superfamily
MDSRLPALLVLLGLDRDFDDVVIPAVCGFAKPDPRIFDFALTRLGIEPGEALYIGDRERDCVEAARAAGLAALRYDPAGSSSDAQVLTDWRLLPDPA